VTKTEVLLIKCREDKVRISGEGIIYLVSVFFLDVCKWNSILVDISAGELNIYSKISLNIFVCFQADCRKESKTDKKENVIF